MSDTLENNFNPEYVIQYFKDMEFPNGRFGPATTSQKHEAANYLPKHVEFDTKFNELLDKYNVGIPEEKFYVMVISTYFNYVIRKHTNRLAAIRNIKCVMDNFYHVAIIFVRGLVRAKLFAGTGE